MREWIETERLCVHITEADHGGHQNLATRIVEEALGHGLAGATAWRGYLSWGPSAHLHSSRILDLGSDLPVVIELVDKTERIESFLACLETILEQAACGALLTREKVQSAFYRRS